MNMIKNDYNVVGVMSGTSLDGIDLCWVHFSKQMSWSFKILAAETVKYSESTKVKLKSAITLNSLDIERLNENYTNLLGRHISDFISKYDIKYLDAVCSHGHTVFHQPEKGVTLQIGNLPELAHYIRQTVVCDFRVQDVRLGGQGAPLVPIGDKLLFPEYDFCLNLGGFANVSTEFDNRRIAYDICPVNIVLNHYVKQLGFNYDNRGRTASTGVIDTELLNELNRLPYYQQNYPKSLGLEWVNNQIFPIVDNYNLRPQDVLRTFIEHSATQIAKVIQNYKLNLGLFSGGGAHNSFLLQRIVNISGCKIDTIDNTIVDFKEALIFGFLGVLKLRNEVNCLKSVTGASHDHCSGEIYFYPNN